MKIEDYLKQGLMPSSVQSYLYEINKYKKHNKKADRYNYQNLMQYIEILQKQYSAGNVKKTIASIKKYYDYLIETGKRKDNPARSIRLRNAKENPIQLQDLFTPKELQNLLKPRKERYPLLAKRNQILLSLLIHQALRVGEIEHIKLSDIDLEKATIQIKETGITNERSLSLKAEQILLLYQYINQDRNSLKTFRNNQNALLLGKLGTPITKDDIDYLISTYQKEFKKKLTATRIRQSVIANLLAKNNDLRTVQYFAGHKSPDTTEKYKETGLNALKTAVEKLHPIK
ncbi:tyrosine-type recombinase/integrase [Flavobacterium soyae]|uniref:tyrosine-type recombinase/integrase n=1 Tax=Flavobacterium soyae TaxID=2903098 RepID=UPI001E60D1A3|nr:tyrosine-type recombinase/integrase [Flavobacterium soyae]MCD9574172.1 tyrosine-type recombinase/integrase [Flavobacterium soyae]